MPRKPKHKGIENTAYIEAMRELRRSSAASKHEDRRTRKARTRAGAFLKAVADQK